MELRQKLYSPRNLLYSNRQEGYSVEISGNKGLKSLAYPNPLGRRYVQAKPLWLYKKSLQKLYNSLERLYKNSTIVEKIPRL